MSEGPVKGIVHGAPARRRVLVVDDEPDWRLLTKEFVSVCFVCDVVTVKSVAEAKATLSSGERFDLVISDFQMPGENGLDLATYLFEFHQDTHFILMTGGSQWRNHPSCKSGLFAMTVVQKPDLRGLFNLIEQLTKWPVKSKPTTWGA